MQFKQHRVFLDDLQTVQHCYHAVVIGSPVDHGYLQRIDVVAVRREPGVIAVLTADDIPGENQIVAPFEAQPLLANNLLRYRGQPMALVVAETAAHARAAAAKARIDVLPVAAVTSIREAYGMGQLLAPPRTIQNGLPQRRWKRADHLFEDRLTIAAQDHGYAEPQGALALPLGDAGLHIYAATETPTFVQRSMAALLQLPYNRIRVETLPLGGSFGGKCYQATLWAALAGFAAYQLDHPVKLLLTRAEDDLLTGRRPACEVVFQIALNTNLRIEAYKATFYLGAGAFADLVPTVAESILLHLNSAYDLPNIMGTVYCCRTNQPPATSARGAGAFIAALALETAIAKAAEMLKIHASEIQANNLLTLNEYFPFGQQADDCSAVTTWQKAAEQTQLNRRIRATDRFNRSATYFRRGTASLPICCGIPYTPSRAQSAGVGVHIYADGSVAIRTDIVDSGLGEHMKLTLLVAKLLNIPPGTIHLLPANTAYQPELSSTPLPPALDLVAKSLTTACLRLRQRLRDLAADMLTQVDKQDVSIVDGWVTYKGKTTRLCLADVATETYAHGHSLSETVSLTMPQVHYDSRREFGEPFAYHVYGTAVCTLTLDTRDGGFTIDDLQVVHDNGSSMCEPLDRTLMEAGIMMGIGWSTLETRPLHRAALSHPRFRFIHYHQIPKHWHLTLLTDHPEYLGIEGSRTVDDPPVLYGLVVYFALRQAMMAAGVKIPPPFHCPLTQRDILMALQDAM